MSTNPTQNEITLKGSLIEYAKKLQSCFTILFKISPFLLFLLSSVTRLHDIREIWIRDKISTKSKTANHWNISTLQQVRPKQYCFGRTITSSSKEQDLQFWVTFNTIIPSTLPTLTMDERHSYLNKADYYSKVNAILSDTYNSVSFIMTHTNTVNYETRRCYQENRKKNPLPKSYFSSSM